MDVTPYHVCSRLINQESRLHWDVCFGRGGDAGAAARAAPDVPYGVRPRARGAGARRAQAAAAPAEEPAHARARGARAPLGAARAPPAARVRHQSAQLRLYATHENSQGARSCTAYD